MKELLLRGVSSIMACLLMGICYAAGTTQEKSGSEAQNKKPESSKQNRYYSEIEEGYVAQLRAMNSDLLNKHAALAGNYYAGRVVYARMKSETGVGISSFVRQSMQTLLSQRAALEAEINAMEKKKEKLKSDFTSFYHGAALEALSRKWDEEEKEYATYIDELYRELQSALTEFNSPEQEQKAWERALQRYRLRHEK